MSPLITVALSESGQASAPRSASSEEPWTEPLVLLAINPTVSKGTRQTTCQQGRRSKWWCQVGLNAPAVTHAYVDETRPSPTTSPTDPVPRAVSCLRRGGVSVVGFCRAVSVQ